MRWNSSIVADADGGIEDGCDSLNEEELFSVGFIDFGEVHNSAGGLVGDPFNCEIVVFSIGDIY